MRFAVNDEEESGIGSDTGLTPASVSLTDPSPCSPNMLNKLYLSKFTHEEVNQT